MTYREFLKELKKRAKKKGLLDSEIEGTTLHSPWKYRTFVTLKDPCDGEKRHLEFGYIEPRKDEDGNEIEPIKVFFRDI